MPTRDTLFRRSPAETKADNITIAVRKITDAAAAERAAKTQRLRAARLEREASEKAQQAASAGATPAKATRKAKTPSSRAKTPR